MNVGVVVNRSKPGAKEVLRKLIEFALVHPNLKLLFEKRTGAMIQQADVELDARGNVKANMTDYRSSTPKIFACGDMRRGQSLVVWAIREGRQCARAVDEFLMGTSELPR